MTAPSKECFKCRQEKPLSDFYHHPMMGDGHLGKCKECTKRDVTENRQRKLDHYREYDRQRSMIEYRVRQRKEWERDHPERRRAHLAVYYALTRGHMVRQSCENCGESIARAHHDDYSKPLDVRWLCARCHARHHAQERMEASS